MPQALTLDGHGQAESDVPDEQQDDAEKWSFAQDHVRASDDVQSFATPQSLSLGGTGWAEYDALDERHNEIQEFRVQGDAQMSDDV